MGFTNKTQTKEERKTKYQFIRLTGLSPTNAQSLRDFNIRALVRYLYHSQESIQLNKK